MAGFLRRNGITLQKTIEEITSGFDFRQPVYEQPLTIGDVYFQFVRTPSAQDPSPTLGSWYCLSGQELTRLGIHSPGSARRVGEFEVVEDVIAVEGIARTLTWNYDLAKYGVGGRGGGTQIYLPPMLRSAVRFRGMFAENTRRAGGW